MIQKTKPTFIKNTNKILPFSHLGPAQILVVGFLVIIIIGASLLSLPIASKNNQGIPLLDAFFTATSAVCVTGLVVVNT